MAKITKITTQKNNRDRYNVFLDRGKGEEYGFSVDEDVLISFQLKKGLEIDEDKMSGILYEDDVRKSLNAAIQFLSHRMRSIKEVRDYLKGKEMAVEVIDRVIDKLLQLKYLNDLEFAKAYVRTQAATTTKGPGLIRGELIEKGLSQAEIEAGLAEFSEEEQQASAVVLAKKKAKQYSKLSRKESSTKIKQALLQKGFPNELINKAMEEIEPADNDWQEQQNTALDIQGNKAHRRYEKYEGWEYEKRMKQFLYRKGFCMEEIEAFIARKREEE